MIFFATLGLSVYLFMVIPKGFFPQQDNGLITATSEASQDISFKAMQSRFGNDQLIQLTTAIGYYSMLAMTVNACELEAAPNAEVLQV